MKGTTPALERNATFDLITLSLTSYQRLKNKNQSKSYQRKDHSNLKICQVRLRTKVKNTSDLQTSTECLILIMQAKLMRTGKKFSSSLKSYGLTS